MHGPNGRSDELPEELARRESRPARIQEAKEALEQEALAAARAEEQRRGIEEEARRQAGETVPKRVKALEWAIDHRQELRDNYIQQASMSR